MIKSYCERLRKELLLLLLHRIAVFQEISFVSKPRSEVKYVDRSWEFYRYFPFMTLHDYDYDVVLFQIPTRD